jgi:hypothetical protein
MIAAHPDVRGNVNGTLLSCIDSCRDCLPVRRLIPSTRPFTRLALTGWRALCAILNAAMP